MVLLFPDFPTWNVSQSHEWNVLVNYLCFQIYFLQTTIVKLQSGTSETLPNVWIVDVPSGYFGSLSAEWKSHSDIKPKFSLQFFCRFCNNYFNSEYYETCGFDYSTKTVMLENTRIKVQLWDMSGDSMWTESRRNYYKVRKLQALEINTLFPAC